jgi:hypothetical protein
MREAFGRYASLDDVFQLGVIGGTAATTCQEDSLLQFELTYLLKSTAFESLSVNASINKALSICFHR